MKKLVALFLVLIMLCAVSVTVFSVSALDENDVLTYDDEDLMKYYTEKSIEAEFEDDGVLFVVTEIASESNPVYTVEDFDESLGVASVSRITSDGAKNHIFYVKLDKHDKQNVLDVIKELNKMSGILCAEPNLISTPSDGYLYKDKFVEEYGHESGSWGYNELYYHYAEDNTIDWVLVRAHIYIMAEPTENPIYRYYHMGDLVYSTCYHYAPFETEYGIYDVARDEFLDLTKIDFGQYNDLKETVSENVNGRPIGDCDKDSRLSVLDATAIQRELALIEKIEKDYFTDSITNTAHRYADFDRDGDVSIMDATAIQMKLARLDVPVATPDEI